jgi:lysophospholipase L1-like esterase
MSFDTLHLTPLGYATLAAAMEPQIRAIMGE